MVSQRLLVAIALALIVIVICHNMTMQWKLSNLQLALFKKPVNFFQTPVTNKIGQTFIQRRSSMETFCTSSDHEKSDDPLVYLFFWINFNS